MYQTPFQVQNYIIKGREKAQALLKVDDLNDCPSISDFALVLSISSNNIGQ